MGPPSEGPGLTVPESAPGPLATLQIPAVVLPAYSIPGGHSLQDSPPGLRQTCATGNERLFGTSAGGCPQVESLSSKVMPSLPRPPPCSICACHSPLRPGCSPVTRPKLNVPPALGRYAAGVLGWCSGRLATWDPNPCVQVYGSLSSAVGTQCHMGPHLSPGLLLPMASPAVVTRV